MIEYWKFDALLGNTEPNDFLSNSEQIITASLLQT
jgi:hypothetical protein